MSEERRKIVRESVEGGVVAYVGRIRDGFAGNVGHHAMFYQKRGTDEEGYSGCSCEYIECNAPLWLEYSQLLIDAYEAKVADFAKETLRYSALLADIEEKVKGLDLYSISDRGELFVSNNYPALVQLSDVLEMLEAMK